VVNCVEPWLPDRRTVPPTELNSGSRTPLAAIPASSSGG
jgi:hypothetical protein